MEGASLGIPSIAVSLEAEPKYHLTYSEEISFLVAAEFTHLFAEMLLQKHFPYDVDLLKVDIPRMLPLTLPGS